MAIVGGVILVIMIVVALFAPWLGTIDPQAVSPAKRLRPPSSIYWFGTDMLGRDVYSRVVYGARISLIVGLAVAVLSTLLGIVIGFFVVESTTSPLLIFFAVPRVRSQLA